MTFNILSHIFPENFIVIPKKTKKTNQVQNRYLDFLIDPNFQGVNRLFDLSFENKVDRESYIKYHILTVKKLKYIN